MEEGPESVIGVVDFCLPIAKKREGYRFGLLYLLSGFNGHRYFCFRSCLCWPLFSAFRATWQW
jgi:hypothetical protein